MNTTYLPMICAACCALGCGASPATKKSADSANAKSSVVPPKSSVAGWETVSLVARAKPKDGPELWRGWDAQGVAVPLDWDEADDKGKKWVPPTPPTDLPPVDPAMGALETSLLAEIVRLRQNPDSYTEALATFRTLYNRDVVAIPDQMSFRTEEGISAVDEAIDVMRTVEPLAPVHRSKRLDLASRVQAYDLAKTSQLSPLGRNGSTVHERLVRFGPVVGIFAENIAAGYTRAPLLILQLLVDDGMPTRSNRFHLLAPAFKLVGIGCAPHPAYRVVCVVDFAESLGVPEGPDGDKQNSDRPGDAIAGDRDARTR